MGGEPGVPQSGVPRVPEQRAAVDATVPEPAPQPPADLRFAVLGPVRA